MESISPTGEYWQQGLQSFVTMIQMIVEPNLVAYNVTRSLWGLKNPKFVGNVCWGPTFGQTQCHATPLRNKAFIKGLLKQLDPLKIESLIKTGYFLWKRGIGRVFFPLRFPWTSKVLYNSMEKGGSEWYCASLIFDTLRHATLQPDVVTCNSMISDA